MQMFATFTSKQTWRVGQHSTLPQLFVSPVDIFLNFGLNICWMLRGMVCGIEPGGFINGQVTIIEYSVPLIGYPQWYGKRGSTLASTSVVLHRDKKSGGVLLKGTFLPGWSVGTASSTVGFTDKEAFLSPPTFTQFFRPSLHQVAASSHTSAYSPRRW